MIIADKNSFATFTDDDIDNVWSGLVAKSKHYWNRGISKSSSSSSSSSSGQPATLAEQATLVAAAAAAAATAGDAVAAAHAHRSAAATDSKGAPSAGPISAGVAAPAGVAAAAAGATAAGATAAAGDAAAAADARDSAATAASHVAPIADAVSAGVGAAMNVFGITPGDSGEDIKPVDQVNLRIAARPPPDKRHNVSVGYWPLRVVREVTPEHIALIGQALTDQKIRPDLFDASTLTEAIRLDVRHWHDLGPILSKLSISLFMFCYPLSFLCVFL
jgi:hypothetical protein